MAVQLALLTARPALAGKRLPLECSAQAQPWRGPSLKACTLALSRPSLAKHGSSGVQEWHFHTRGLLAALHLALASRALRDSTNAAKPRDLLVERHCWLDAVSQRFIAERLPLIAKTPAMALTGLLLQC